MHAKDMLFHGNRTINEAIQDFPADAWEQSGACGVWSVKDIMAHLASFEAALADILRGVAGEASETPTLDRLLADYMAFNDNEVINRRDHSVDAVLTEYAAQHAAVMRLIEQVSDAQLTQDGLLSWYGPDYDLEDFIVYANYAHKREHAAQIHAKRDTL